MKPPPLTPQPDWHHLPRLAPEFYRGFAAVLWTITLERRATGWLDDRFHLHFRELLLHAAARAIPKGLCPSAQGREERATLGHRGKNFPTAKRLWQFRSRPG